MFGVIFKFFGIAFATVLVFFMAANSFRKARRLDARIRAFKAELAEREKQGQVMNPYQALSELYEEEARKDAERARRRRRR